MRRAIVTGASRGIGRAVTEMLLADGWAVLGVCRTDPGLEHKHFGWLKHDLGGPPGVEMAGWYWGSLPIDALIHCAGIRGPYGLFTENDPEAWIKTVETNLLGTFRVVRAALPLLQRSEDGRIILFSGGGAFSPEPRFSAYATTKGATVALAETLAEELRGTNVSVNCVAPGFVATDIHRGTPLEGKSDGGGAMGAAVACIRHLLSPATRGLTGRTISAQHDDWSSLSPFTIPHLGDQGTRDRHKVAQLQNLLIRARHAI